MSALLYGLLSDKLDEIAALYKVRPRITLIVRMPGKPDECAFLSDDAWPDAVATVERLYRDPGAFKAGPPEPPPDAAPAQPAPLEEAVREALWRFGAVAFREFWGYGNPGDIDGGAAQEAAEEYGLWHQVERHADGVECEWCGNDGPCGELTEVGRAALAARPSGGGR